MYTVRNNSDTAPTEVWVINPEGAVHLRFAGAGRSARRKAYSAAGHLNDLQRAREAQAGINLRDANGRKLHEPAMMAALGLRGGQHLPVDGLPEQMIGNVRVWVKPLTPIGLSINQENDLRRTGRRVKSSAHRVMCECPDCGFITSAGRLHQHQGTPACTNRINRTLRALQRATDLRG